MDVRARRHRRAAWLVALPIAAASWLSAHCLAYLLVPPADSGAMHHHMDESHNWFGSMPVLVAAGVTVLAAGLVLCIGEGWAGRQELPGALARLRTAAGGRIRGPGAPRAVPRFGLGALRARARADLHHGARASASLCPGGTAACGRTLALGYRFGRLLARAIPAGPAVDRQQIPVVSLVRPARVAVSSVLVRAHAPRAPPCAACS